MVIALAGRRIDATNAATPRFPTQNESFVRQRLDQLISELGAKGLVCSAACGVDLIALEAASAAGLRRRIVLPYDPNEFRKTSVTDRGPAWGPRFDAQIANAELVDLRRPPGDDTAYAAANNAIFEEAMVMAADLDFAVTAVVVWEGRSRGDGDLTDAFRTEALVRGLPLREVSTQP
jgi:hypothetical protein